MMTGGPFLGKPLSHLRVLSGSWYRQIGILDTRRTDPRGENPGEIGVDSSKNEENS